MNRKIIFTLLCFLLVGLAGCSVFFPSQAQREANQTAVAATRTQMAANAAETIAARGPTNTPRPSVFEAMRTPTPTTLPTPTPLIPIGELTLREGESWVDVYDSPGDKAKWIGELVKGSNWSVTQSFSQNHYWELVAFGFLEPLDFDPEKEETKCIFHSWDHISLCHTHLMNKHGELVGQVDGGVKVTHLEAILDKNGRVVRHQIQFLVWVPESEGDFKTK